MPFPTEIHSLMQHMSPQLQAPTASASDQGLGVQFETLMHRASAPPTVSNEENSQTISKLVIAQDDELQRAVSDVLSITDAASGMSMQELQAASMQMQLELAGMQMDMQSKMAVVDSTKSAIETLMRQE
jgi:type III secretion inner rod protein HrpB2